MLNNELPNNNTNNNQHSVCASSNQNNIVPNKEEHNLFQMDSESIENKQIVSNGPSINTISSIKDPSAYSALYQKLDEIGLSDSEDENINDVDLEKQHNQIAKAYEEGEDEGKYFGTKNEKLEYEIPVLSKITENSKIDLLGYVESVIDGSLLVKKVGSSNLIELDSTVFSKNMIAIGFISDIIGNIEDPYYVVSLVEKVDLAENCEVYYDKNNVKVVDTTEVIKNSKKTDASNIYDEEISDSEYSDDEVEIEMKKKKKNNKQNKANNHNVTNTNTISGISNSTNTNESNAYNYNKSNLNLRPDQIDPFLAFQGK